MRSIAARPNRPSLIATFAGRAWWLAVASLALLAITGCGMVSAGAPGAVAQVRFVEVSPGAPEMDFSVNGASAAYGVGYESFTSYLPVAPGTATLSVNRIGGGQVLASAQGALAGGKQYTAVLAHGPGNLQMHLFDDQDTPAAPGRMSLRFINEVEGAGNTTVYLVAAGPSASTVPVAVVSVAPGTASAYLDLPAGAGYTAIATESQAGLHLPVGENVNIKGSSGAVRTVVFAGTVPAVGHGRVVGFTLADADLP